ncbi:MAG: sigma 54-interacting transcriptional regulator [Phycisphaerae bacterium]|nr:sigma 54-interacting transcriptional regulator [Phycisphaerae bacterium]
MPKETARSQLPAPANSNATSLNPETLHAIATMVAQKRSVSAVLATIVESLVEQLQLALARVWLVQPGDICDACPMREECPDRSRCLHLVSTAHTQSNPGSGHEWHRPDGFYRRFPLGIRRIGSIGASGKSQRLSDAADDREWFARDDWLRREGVRSFVGHPLIFDNEILGVLAVFSRTALSDQEFTWLRAFADSAAVAIANARAFEEIEELKRRLELENAYLRDAVDGQGPFGDMVGKGAALQSVARQIELVAATDSTVMILGESGTGKELVAREIHRRSKRAHNLLVTVNCAAVPRELFESEFFGHARGSFTGAYRERVGRFELASGSTLFLDEVAEIPLDLQSKLLRVLQEGELERIGEERTRKTDVRVIAATNRNLKKEVEAGRFRNDLYYRLSVFPIEVAPLRRRKEDIYLLAAHFVEKIARRLGRPVPQLTLATMQKLQQHDWPGNIRELQHVLERALITSPPERLRLPELTSGSEEVARGATVGTSADEAPLTAAELRRLEITNLRKALRVAGGKIYGAGGAAALLGMTPTTLSSRLKALGLRHQRLS